jgi:CDP-4-dehydro-6-deoxyglucose reductase
MARSDLCLESREVRSLEDIPIRTLPARVHKLTRAAPDVMIIDLKLPANERLQFLAGQYVDILLKEGRRRSFSLANAPHADDFLQLHVRQVPGGQFTEHVFDTMKERDLLRLRGPHGSFFLREDSANRCCWSPAEPALRRSRRSSNTPSPKQHAGRCTSIGVVALSRRPLPVALAERGLCSIAHIRFTPVLSDSPEAEHWTGSHRPGARSRDGGSSRLVRLSGLRLWRTGDGAAARRDFLDHCQLPPEEFFADSFDFAADTLRRWREACTSSAIRVVLPQGMNEVFMSRQALVNRQSRIIATRLTLHPGQRRQHGGRGEHPQRAGRRLATWRQAGVHQLRQQL